MRQFCAPKGKQRLSREKLEPENIVSEYIYPGKIPDSGDAGQGRMLSIPRLANSFPHSADPCEALNPQTP
jgi:hypothetical protein